MRAAAAASAGVLLCLCLILVVGAWWPDDGPVGLLVAETCLLRRALCRLTYDRFAAAEGRFRRSSCWCVTWSTRAPTAPDDAPTAPTTVVVDLVRVWPWPAEPVPRTCVDTAVGALVLLVSLALLWLLVS